MSRLVKEWLSIADVSRKLEMSEGDVEYCLIESKLSPAIRLPLMTLRKCSIEFDGDDILTNGLGDKSLSGVYYINGYENIKWTDSGNGGLYFDCFNRNFFLCGDNSDEFYKFRQSYQISLNDILINLNEVNAFESNFEISNEIDQHQKFKPDYLDAENKYFSKELETAISAWTSLYGKGLYRSKDAHKKQIKDFVTIHSKKNNYGLSNEAISRITTIVNPNKKGGATPTE
ncbi:hypothetical protein HXX01_04370 [Candidatus Nomurabacteria bacterium]|nr:hypothetical protein [Candidatus Nomurabacteria bacterium]